MKNQALFSSKHKSQKIKCRLLQFLYSALRVNDYISDEVIPYYVKYFSVKYKKQRR